MILPANIAHLMYYCKSTFQTTSESHGKAQKKLIVIPTTNLALTLKSNTMKNSMQNYKIIFKQCYITYKI